jgi:hypothetical protein
MREIRTSGSEGGGDRKVSPYPYQTLRVDLSRFWSDLYAAAAAPSESSSASSAPASA